MTTEKQILSPRERVLRMAARVEQRRREFLEARRVAREEALRRNAEVREQAISQGV